MNLLRMCPTVGTTQLPRARLELRKEKRAYLSIIVFKKTYNLKHVGERILRSGASFLRFLFLTRPLTRPWVHWQATGPWFWLGRDMGLHLSSGQPHPQALRVGSRGRLVGGWSSRWACGPLIVLIFSPPGQAGERLCCCVKGRSLETAQPASARLSPQRPKAPHVPELPEALHTPAFPTRGC